uniref:Uncharacterized protein n=1 Tax=Octactis speculum TaxID=3111310 RepID=A0A7S2FAM2_9STRA
MSRCHDRVLFVKTEIKRGEEVLGEVGRSFLDEDCDPGKVPTVVLTSNGTYAKLSMTEGGALHVTLLQFPDGSQLSFRTSQTQIWISPHGHENAIINVDGSATYIDKRSSFAAGEPAVVRVDFNADGSRVASLQDGSRVHIEAKKKEDGPNEEDNGVEEGGLGASITSNGGLEANILSIDGAFTRVERKKNNGTSAQSILQPDGTLLYRNTETREDWALQEGDRLVVMREGLILPPRVSCDAAAADGRKTTSILKPRRMLLDIDNGFETNLNEEIFETESGIKEETCQGVIPAPRVTRTTH